MRVSYNAPVVLTFAFLSGVVLALDHFTGGWIVPAFFSAGKISFIWPPSILGVFTHVLGHVSWEHLAGNFVLIMLMGPLLEEKYGSKKLLFMIAATALATGLINSIFFSANLTGSSGVAFMMLILASCANIRRGEIPVTLLLASVFYLGGEAVKSFTPDNISQFGHILGGICGGIFGIWFADRKPLSG